MDNVLYIIPSYFFNMLIAQACMLDNHFCLHLDHSRKKSNVFWDARFWFFPKSNLPKILVTFAQICPKFAPKNSLGMRLHPQLLRHWGDILSYLCEQIPSRVLSVRIQKFCSWTTRNSSKFDEHEREHKRSRLVFSGAFVFAIRVLFSAIKLNAIANGWYYAHSLIISLLYNIALTSFVTNNNAHFKIIFFYTKELPLLILNN